MEFDLSSPLRGSVIYGQGSNGHLCNIPVLPVGLFTWSWPRWEAQESPWIVHHSKGINCGHICLGQACDPEKMGQVDSRGAMGQAGIIGNMAYRTLGSRLECITLNYSKRRELITHSLKEVTLARTLMPSVVLKPPPHSTERVVSSWEWELNLIHKEKA